MRKAVIIQLVTMVVISVLAIAQQDVQVSAHVSPKSIGQDDIVQFSIRISGATGQPKIDINLAELKDFDILNRQTSQNYTQINNQISSYISYIYNLHPKKTGTLTIPSITVDINGSRFHTDPQTVVVSKQQENNNILVRLYPDKRSAYVGEQIVVNWELLFRVHVHDYELLDQPSQEGFITVDDESVAQNNLADIVRVDGIEYNRAILRRQIFFPLQSGKRTIKPIRFRISYRASTFSMGTKIANRSTPEITLDIKPLPAGAPEGFLGAVGDYKIDWQIDRLKGKANEPFTLDITLSGIGDIERAPEMRPQLPSNFEILNSSSRNSTQMINGYWSGVKSWEFILIPKQAGDISLGPLEFPFFHPGREKYEIATTDVISLSISEADKIPSLSVPVQIDVDSVEGDIRYIKTSARLKVLKNSNYAYWILAGLSAFVVLANLGIFIVKRFVKSSPEKVRGKRRQKALKTLIIQLQKMHNKVPSTENLTAIKDNIIEYFASKLSVDSTDLTSSGIRAEMVRYDLHETDETNSLLSFLNMCEVQKYAPVKISVQEFNNKLDECIANVEKLDGVLR